MGYTSSFQYNNYQRFQRQQNLIIPLLFVVGMTLLAYLTLLFYSTNQDYSMLTITSSDNNNNNNPLRVEQFTKKDDDDVYNNNENSNNKNDKEKNDDDDDDDDYVDYNNNNNVPNNNAKDNGKNNRSNNNKNNTLLIQLPTDITNWDKCNYEQLCSERTTTTTNDGTNDKIPLKPLWLSGYPQSGDELFRPTLIGTMLLQNQYASKNYYAGRKKCMSSGPPDITATCSQIHPIVGLNPSPDQRTSTFNSNIIFLLRNPKTAIPAHYQDKAVKYHNVIGQVPEKDWIAFRDEYILPKQQQVVDNNTSTDTSTPSPSGAIETWANVINVWKSYTKTYYNISLYIPYEHMFDYRHGPMIVQKLIQLLHECGFSNLPILIEKENENNPTDELTTTVSCVECIWYKAITKERIEQYIQYQYEYSTYQPLYTNQQRDYIVSVLQQLRKQYNTDRQLKYILGQYVHDLLRMPTEQS